MIGAVLLWPLHSLNRIRCVLIRVRDGPGMRTGGSLQEAHW